MSEAASSDRHDDIEDAQGFRVGDDALRPVPNRSHVRLEAEPKNVKTAAIRIDVQGNRAIAAYAVTAPIAMTQPLGLTHWKAAACRKVSGRPATFAMGRPRRCDPPGEIEEIRGAGELQHRVEHRIGGEEGAEAEADDQHHEAEAEGDAKACGSVRLKPKFSPDVISMMLFGPGVKRVATANTTKARNNSVGI